LLADAAWTYISNININRSLTVMGRTVTTRLDFNWYSDLFALQPNVVLVWSTLTFLNSKRVNPLQPGARNEEGDGAAVAQERAWGAAQSLHRAAACLHACMQAWTA
jgi:hypothetical protein